MTAGLSFGEGVDGGALAWGHGKGRRSAPPALEETAPSSAEPSWRDTESLVIGLVCWTDDQSSSSC